jgi:hypothetical protein
LCREWHLCGRIDEPNDAPSRLSSGTAEVLVSRPVASSIRLVIATRWPGGGPPPPGPRPPAPGGPPPPAHRHKSADEFGADLGAALDKLLGNPDRAAGTLGAIANSGVLKRLDQASELGRVLRKSEPVALEQHPDATVRSPLVARLDADEAETYTREWFGPISFVIATESTVDSLRIFTDTVRAHGALTASVYSTDPDLIATARAAALDAGVSLSENLTGGVFVNQSAAFSDFHGTGANPAATTALSDPAFVTGRFHVLQSRHHATAG